MGLIRQGFVGAGMSVGGASAGAELLLPRAGVRLACGSGFVPDNLAADGGIAGFVTDPDGVRRALSTPDGWTVNSVIELTDHGLLVANVRDASGAVRPAVWELNSASASGSTMWTM